MATFQLPSTVPCALIVAAGKSGASCSFLIPKALHCAARPNGMPCLCHRHDVPHPDKRMIDEIMLPTGSRFFAQQQPPLWHLYLRLQLTYCTMSRLFRLLLSYLSLCSVHNRFSALMYCSWYASTNWSKPTCSLFCSRFKTLLGSNSTGAPTTTLSGLG